MRGPRNLLRTGGLVAVGMAAAFVAAENGASLFGGYLAEPDHYGDRSRAVKVAQLADTEDCVDVVIAGNSMARDGFWPEVFSTADPEGRSAYNASLDAASPELLDLWLHSEVLPRAQPATVLLAITSTDLNAESVAAQAALGSWQTSVAGSEGFLGSAERFASGHFALFEHRRQLRDPGEVAEALGRLFRGEPAERTHAGAMQTVLGPAGEGRSRQDMEFGPDPAADRFVTEQLLNDFDLGDDPAGRVEDLVQSIRSTGTDVVLVLLPVTEHFVALHPGRHNDIAAAREAVQEASSRTDAPVIDLSELNLAPEDFADSHHLNRRGAQLLSAAVPRALFETGVEPRLCGIS